MAGHHSGSSIWELSLYESQRKPHEVFTDSTVIGVSPRALHSELMCPICLDLMKTTLTTKECLHRFCQECIITALRSGNKECPTCRKKLVSKRSLRADPNFDALISKIYPNRDELLQQQQQLQQQQLLQDKQRVAKPLWQCGVQKRKLQQRRQGTPSEPDASVDSEQVEEKRPRVEEPEEPPPPKDEIAAMEEKEPKEEGPVELQLRPHPQDDSLSDEVIRNVSTTPNATVAHLAKFLSIHNQHPHLVGTSHYSLAIQLSAESHEYQVLGNGITLKQICENYWLPGEKLMLFFKLTSDK